MKGFWRAAFWINVQDGNVYEVNNLYETSFPKLTDQFFKVESILGEEKYWRENLNHLLSPQASPWPEAEDVAPYVNDDPIFLNLYRCSFIWDKSGNILCVL